MNNVKIVVTPPGPKAREVLKKDQSLLSPSLGRLYPLVVESGEGCLVRDVDGNTYLDFSSGLVVLNLGHRHPKVVEAIHRQAEKLLHYSYSDFYYPEVVELAQALTKITPGKFAKKVFYGNSGAEAIEAGMKLSRWHTRRQYLIAFLGAFHGRTYGALSLTASKPVQRRHFAPLLPSVQHIPYPYCYRCPMGGGDPDECGDLCLAYLEDQVLKRLVPPEDVAAIVFEPIQGEGGYIVPPKGFFPKLQKIASKHGILLVDDEVQSGIGRTGRWFGIEHWEVEPDVVCVAKGLASGLPIGATIAREELMDWEAGSHASTFGGNPVACASALAVIKAVEEERLLDNATKQGRYILRRLSEMGEKNPLFGEVRGKGLMIGVELVKDQKTKTPAPDEAKALITRCFRQGLVLTTCGVSTIRFTPPLTLTQELAEEGLEVFEAALKEMERESTQ